MFIFRVDSSREIGSGHLQRCVTLARELNHRGHASTFMMRNSSDGAFDFIERSGHNIIRLSTVGFHPPLRQDPFDSKVWLGTNQRRDAEDTVKVIKREDLEEGWLIADHYGIGREWEETARNAGLKMMVIDDLMTVNHDCDLLLNQNVLDTRGVHAAYRTLVSDSASLFAGPRYALLDPVYRQLRMGKRAQRRNLGRALIYYGSGDPTNETLKAVQAFATPHLRRIQIDIVLGRDSVEDERIHELARNRGNCTVYKDLPHLGDLLMVADICLGAGGTTSIERFCLGVPAIVTTIAVNQEEVSKYAHQLGLLFLLGRSAHVRVDDVVGAIERCFDDVEALNVMSERAFSLVDGCGAERVADILCGDLRIKATLRPATLLDEDLLFCWANDPLVRANAFNHAEISIEAHKNWFGQSLMSEECRIWVMDVNGRPAGQVRWNKKGDRATLDYSIANEYRGKGLGKLMIRLSVREIGAIWPDCILQAKVLPTNVASIKLLKAVGFNEIPGEMEHNGRQLVFRHTDPSFGVQL